MFRQCFLAAALVAAPVSPVFAAAVDLATWQVDGDGNWTLEAGNNGVTQSLNSRPTVFHDGSSSSFGKSLSGTIEVQTTSDDDWVGFVVGYSQGDIDNAPDQSPDYLLIDWKQGTQSGWDAGLALSRVTGAIDASGTATGSVPWQHNGTIELLTRSNAAGSNFGLTGWADNTEYTFDIEFTASNIKVYVNGQLEIDWDALGLSPYADGAFGFYNYSQPNVRYAGIQEDVLPSSQIPLPAAAPLMAAALGGLGLMRLRRRRGG